MFSLSRALQVVMRCVRAVAGRAEPEPDAEHTLEESGISTDLQLRELKTKITAELSREGFELQKMGLDELKPSSTIKDVAEVVSYARPVSERFY